MADSSNQFTNVVTNVDADSWAIKAESFKLGLKQTLATTMVIKR